MRKEGPTFGSLLGGVAYAPTSLEMIIWDTIAASDTDVKYRGAVVLEHILDDHYWISYDKNMSC